MPQYLYEELNKKLAEWAGFTQVKNRWHFELTKKIFDWLFPDKRETGQLPNFTQSLDACFKHLVPISIDKIMDEQGCSSDVAYAILFKRWLQELELIIPEAALALCLAISELIDKEKKC